MPARSAWQIHQVIAGQPSQNTRFGIFHFALKVSVVAGAVEWGVWQAAATATPALTRQHATYFFGGEALDQCLTVDASAQAGAVMLTNAVYAQLPQTLVTVEEHPPYYRLLVVDDSLGTPLSSPTAVVAPSPMSALPSFFRQCCYNNRVKENSARSPPSS